MREYCDIDNKPPTHVKVFVQKADPDPQKYISEEDRPHFTLHLCDGCNNAFEEMGIEGLLYRHEQYLESQDHT